MKAGTARLLIAGQFGSEALIGFALAVFADVRFDHHAVTANERDVTWAISALMLAVGILGAIRAMRCRIVLLDDQIKVVGVIRSRNLRGSEIDVVAFGRTPYGPVLSFVLSHARPVIAWGVSKGHRRNSEDPDEVMKRIQERARREGACRTPIPVHCWHPRRSPI